MAPKCTYPASAEKALWLCVMLVLAGCDDPVKPPAPATAVSEPPPSASVVPAIQASAPLAASASASPHTVASASAPPTPTPNVAHANENEGPGVIAWQPNGRAFAAGLGKKVSIIPVDGSKPRVLADHTGNVTAIVFSNKGDRLATTDSTDRVRLWDPNSGKLLADLVEAPKGEIYSVAFSDDSSLFAAAASTVVIWDTEKKKKRCSTVEDRFYAIAFTRDQQSLVTTGVGSSNRWDTATCAHKAGGSAQTGGTFGSWVGPDGKHVAASVPDGHGLALYEAKSFQEIERLASSAGCRDHIGPVRFSRDGEILLASGSHQWFRSFRVDSKKTIAAYDIPKGDEVNQLVMFDEGERLLVVRGDRGELVSVPSKTIAYTIELKGAQVFDLSWDRKYLLGAGQGQAHLWDTQTGKLVQSFPVR